MYTGYIYIIYSDDHDFVYIGSRKLDLNKRLKQHELNLRKYKRNKYNYVSSYDVLELGNYQIDWLHKGQHKSRRSLRLVEGNIIKKFLKISDCILVNNKLEGEGFHNL